MTITAHKIHLNPTPEQEDYLRRACGTRRFTFNWALATWNRQQAAGDKPSALDHKQQFNAIREAEYPWTYDVTKCAVEGAFFDLKDAFGLVIDRDLNAAINLEREAIRILRDVLHLPVPDSGSGRT